MYVYVLFFEIQLQTNSPIPFSTPISIYYVKENTKIAIYINFNNKTLKNKLKIP